jgi:hypothetical protein
VLELAGAPVPTYVLLSLLLLLLSFVVVVVVVLTVLCEPLIVVGIVLRIWAKQMPRRCRRSRRCNTSRRLAARAPSAANASFWPMSLHVEVYLLRLVVVVVSYCV